MIKLIRETPKDEIFSRQQWWLAGESYEVLVSYEQPLCYFHITDKTQKKDISWTIAERLGQINGTQLDTTATIDSQFVKIPESHVQEFLLEIDKLGMKTVRL
ncbi:hypothetical protein BGP_2689 [Beggiatoa sp. PS]|nr:hypothetical protein BGP_2689 [Beggiatoa sp. PS]